MIERFKKEAYTIPVFTVGGSTRPNVNTLASTGSAIYLVSGITGISVTVNGTRRGSSALFQETFTVTQSSSAGGIASSYSDWTSVLGHQVMDKYGMTPTTQAVEISVYGVSTAGGSTAQVSYSSSGANASKMVAFALQGRDITTHTVSGNNYMTTKPLNNGTTPIAPSSVNAFKFTIDMISDERVRDYALFNSDTGGATVQIKVWEA
jgi:hypothetical protein